MSDDEKNPWTTLGTRVVYENPWIRFVDNEVRALAMDGTVTDAVSIAALLKVRRMADRGELPDDVAKLL